MSYLEDFFCYPESIRPSKILDQQFALTLQPSDFQQPLTIPRYYSRLPAGYIRPWRSSASDKDAGSTVKYEDDKFIVDLDVQQFKPEEVSVKVTGENTLTIEAKHEEQKDEYGYISRHFVRKYVLPKNSDTNRIESKLSSDGVLTVIAPKKDPKIVEEKAIPIKQTGEPLKN